MPPIDAMPAPRRSKRFNRTLSLIAAFLVAVLFIQFAVVRPIRRLTVAAERISVGEAADLGAARINRKSRNEVQQLILATERLRASMTLAMQRLAKRPPPPPGAGPVKGGE